MMKGKDIRIIRIIVLVVFGFHGFFSFFYGKAVLVHNSMKEIEACKGKLKLKLIRIWGGDEEQDENKFFNTPRDVVVDTNNSVYISDKYRHYIQVFDSSGKYLRTIGRLGKGPGDLFGPTSMSLAPGGNLWVCENASFRLQCFNPAGKSIYIIKLNDFPNWVGVNSKNEIAVYTHQRTIETGKLLAFCNTKGDVIREIGKYTYRSKKYIEAERLIFSIDSIDNMYAANRWTPVIRKYTPDGKLEMAITYDTIYDVPVKVTLTQGGDEIDCKWENDIKSVEVKRNGGALTFLNNKKIVISGIAIDSQKRIYIVTARRILSEKENRAFMISGTSNWINRKQIDYSIAENPNCERLLVFDPGGKVIAEAPLKTVCDGFYVNGSRIFIIDGYINQRILEYEMTFEK
jgi:hypothetical protein